MGIELANRLIEFPAGSEECERGLAMLQALSEGPHGAAAKWLLGVFYLQAVSLPGAHAVAASWLTRAAGAGVAPAMDRLANLHLRGLGVAASRASALELLGRLADCGFQQAAWDVGYLLGQEANGAMANAEVTAFARACALGFPPAYYSLGLRMARGHGVARDACFARALLRRASDAGFPDAIRAAEEYAPESGGDPLERAWYERLKSNHASSQPMLAAMAQDGITIDVSKSALLPRLEAHFATLGHPAIGIDAHGRLAVAGTGSSVIQAEPNRWETLSQQPRVEIGRNFLSREECAHLVYDTLGGLSRPEQYTGSSINGLTEIRQFTGKGKSLGALTSDTVVRTIEQRIATRTGFPIDRIEPCSIIAYEPGEEYQSHVDYFSADQIERNRVERKDPSGQRVATFLMCLEAPLSGGETVYESTGLTLRYESGMAALHFNVTAEGVPDRLSVHRGRPVESGRKWLMRTTLRERSLYV